MEVYAINAQLIYAEVRNFKHLQLQGLVKQSWSSQTDPVKGPSKCSDLLSALSDFCTMLKG